jgi:hypothetical protein
MIEKIKSLATDSKYTTWYCSIINNAMARTDDIEGERHHVVPRSIWPDGILLKENIVKLTYKEHYVCHKLLARMLIDPAHTRKMRFALWRLTHKRVNDQMCNSRDYESAKVLHKQALEELWAQDGFREDMLKSRKWFYESEDQKSANSRRAKERLQNPEFREKFFKAANEANKIIRDSDPIKWAQQSMRSAEGKANAKKTQQTDSHRKACSERELNKSPEQRLALAKQGQQALVDKLGGEEAYREYLSNRIKGRRKYINPSDGSIRILREAVDGYVLMADYKLTVRNHYVYI